MNMTQEEKKLLLIDLCARLPYDVYVHIGYKTGEPCYGKLTPRDIQWFIASKIEQIKPYLRPMSSMTDEENAILNNISNKDRGYEEDEDGWVRCDSIHTKWGVWPDGCAKLLDYLNSIHVDYRGLIPMGLALEAPEGMYKNF